MSNANTSHNPDYSCLLVAGADNIGMLHKPILPIATYQFSNTELQSLKILLQFARDVTTSSVIITEDNAIINNSANNHIATINNILAARSTR